MNILLINPTMNKSLSRISSFFPSGLTYLASYLVKNGFNVKILDLQTVPRTELNSRGISDILEKEIKSFNPEIVGIGCLFSHYLPNIKDIARKLKSLNPNVFIVIGGLHPTIFCKEIITGVKEIDSVMLGEGEISLLKLCNKLKNGIKNFKDIDGIAYRNNGEVIINPKTSFIENLDTLPFPAFDKINIENYVSHLRYNKKNRGMSVMTSRSCPNRCTFCSMFHTHGSRWRCRSAENVLDEMEFLYKNYHIRNFQFMDDNMSFSRDRTIEIFRAVMQRGMDITFSFPNGIAIKTLDREVLSVMKEAGCVEIRLPIESGSEYIRNKVMKKNLSSEKIFEVIELCNEFEFPTIGYFIIGTPGENRETLEENINFIKKLKGRWFVDFLAANFMTPYPGTKVYEQCVKEGLIDNTVIKQLIDGTATIFDKPIIKLKTLTEKELIKHRKEIWKISFKQNFFRILKKYLKPTRNNYQIVRAVIHRFVLGY